MTRWILLLVLLSPAIEVYALVAAAQNFPGFVAAEVALAAALGLGMMRRGRDGFGRATDDLRRRGGVFSLAPFWRFGKLWLAGVLLLIPGFLTDALGAVVWLLPDGDDSDFDSDFDPDGGAGRYEVVVEESPRVESAIEPRS